MIGAREREREPGAALAAELRALAEADARRTPMDALLDAAGRGELDEDRCFRLLGRLWIAARFGFGSEAARPVH